MLISNKELHYRVLIIGGGPIGLACALEAKKAGIKHLILEKGALVNSLYNSICLEQCQANKK
jgi:thioredoxin reductase